LSVNCVAAARPRRLPSPLVERSARLVLVDAAGTVFGALPPVKTAMPWWQEVSDVVPAVREAFGVDVTVLRILGADRPEPHGGTVTYLAQVDGPPPRGLAPAEVDPTPQPHRLPYAVPGGPDRTLAWARDVLDPPAVTAHQQRTWNLSAIWRLDGPDGPRAWLKQVPPFFRHEGAVLRWLGDAVPGAAPPLIAAGDEGRVLVAHVPGEDGYDAGAAAREAVAAVHHRIQVAAMPAVDTLARAGVPDRRGPKLAAWIRSALAGHDLDAVIPDLERRLAAVAACGLPDTLVHGDLHGGNARLRAGEPPVVFDWGDSSLGCPAVDIHRLTGDLDPDGRERMIAAWARRWRAVVPGADPERAVALVGPVYPLFLAAAYATFLANIEPAEQPYHRRDVPNSLADVAARLARERSTVGG
jgi:hypothetical protein